MKRIFFDVTNLRIYLESGRRLSGIQRVVVMLVDYTAQYVGADHVFLSFYDNKTSSYNAISYNEIEKFGGILSEDNLISLLNKKPRIKTRPTLERYAQHPLKLRLHTAIRNINCLINNHQHFQKRGSTIKDWKASKNKKIDASYCHNKPYSAVNFSNYAQNGDKLIIADASWSMSLDPIKKARNDGISCYFLIHDLIQIKAPELISGRYQSQIFYDWLLETSKISSSYLANSKYTAFELREFLVAHSCDQEVHTIPLATAPIPKFSNATSSKSAHTLCTKSDLYPNLSTSAMINDKILNLIKYPYVLCVGTMETRKNMWRLFQAWEKLRHYNDIDLPKLVFAGNPGWLNLDFENAMNATKNLYGWIELVQSPSDTELDFLYRNCLFTAMPSLYEGWGLPVGESLSYGKTAVVSNVSSLPEVGGDLVLYFDPRSINSITSVVHRMLSEDGLRQSLENRIQSANLRGWDAVAKDIVDVVTDTI
ncbi:MAG: glycosyltransferase family 1 protein [Candidatus Aquiluna sp. XM-24bin5]|nr:MAG: glycosyltransferase family 1 protein [Candidatus Aquiluna sp. XM-24bin5]